MTGLYVHVPYRAASRPHDDAYTVVDPTPDASILSTALAREIDRHADSVLDDVPIRSLYVGGGRPSLCRPGALRPLVRVLGRVVEPTMLDEVTVELHPADTSPVYLCHLRRVGVTRLSIEGLSFVEEDLDAMAAPHGPDDLVRSIRQVRRAGFRQFSVDLLFGGAGQSRAGWKASLQRAVSLGVPHLTLHELETGDTKKRADQLAFALTFLRAKGYVPYELTHFARPGHQSLHQEHVYAHGDILGLGPGAESFWTPDAHDSSAARRRSNVADLTAYVERLQADATPVAHDETLSTSALAREYMLLRLRTQAGLDLDALADRYDLRLRDRKADTLRRLRRRGLIHEDPARVALTDRGRLLTDAITRRLLRELGPA
ncbi:coproporphyrinogen-III oxidase family protein [Salinibacter ruber]|uniref:coproporphyrinogen-III oxidase family protein n=1 Tax=Salinibacter ruber TaxID=146919 RepID=UPI000E5871D0|nr:coproporphyrinogen III oxidase [Salinibacter ruber]